MKSCIFCQIAQGKIPSSLVRENEHALAFFDINPISPYHTLVVPRAHHANLFDAPPEVLHHCMDLISEVTTLYREKLGLEHLQLLSNSGRAAGQEVFHLHFHLIPRSPDDDHRLRWKARPEYRKLFPEWLQALSPGSK